MGFRIGRIKLVMVSESNRFLPDSSFPPVRIVNLEKNSNFRLHGQTNRACYAKRKGQFVRKRFCINSCEVPIRGRQHGYYCTTNFEFEALYRFTSVDRQTRWQATEKRFDMAHDNTHAEPIFSCFFFLRRRSPDHCELQTERAQQQQQRRQAHQRMSAARPACLPYSPVRRWSSTVDALPSSDFSALPPFSFLCSFLPSSEPWPWSHLDRPLAPVTSRSFHLFIGWLIISPTHMRIIRSHQEAAGVR